MRLNWRPGGWVEVCQLECMSKTEWASVRLLGRTVHVGRQVPTGKPGAGPGKTLAVGPVWHGAGRQNWIGCETS